MYTKNKIITLILWRNVSIKIVKIKKNNELFMYYL